MLTALKQAGIFDVVSQLLLLAQRHLVDLCLVSIACWAVVKLQRRPRELWWTLAAIGCCFLQRNGLSNVFLLIHHFNPAAFAGVSTGSGTDTLRLVFGIVNLAVTLVLTACVWWCVLQAAFVDPYPAEEEAPSLDPNHEPTS